MCWLLTGVQACALQSLQGSCLFNYMESFLLLQALVAFSWKEAGALQYLIHTSCPEGAV